MITTHRGRRTNFRENSIAAFNEALRKGCDSIECDLRLTLDNKIVVHHDNKILLKDKKLLISKTLLIDLVKINFYQKDENIITLEELFNFIEINKVPFFLEVKSSSQLLAESIIEKIEEKNLWARVHIVGFSFFIKTAVTLQKIYPKLKVLQLVGIPLYSYIKIPKSSYGVMLGWFDDWHGSEWLFKKAISVNRLIKLREFYERNGFKVMAGVINKESGFKYFKDAGITDIVTDNVLGAINYFKK